MRAVCNNNTPYLIFFFLVAATKAAASDDLIFIPPGTRPAIFHRCHEHTFFCASKQCTNEKGTAGRLTFGPTASTYNAGLCVVVSQKRIKLRDGLQRSYQV